MTRCTRQGLCLVAMLGSLVSAPVRRLFGVNIAFRKATAIAISLLSAPHTTTHCAMRPPGNMCPPENTRRCTTKSSW